MRVVARGARWVVVDKPSGVLSVPGKGPGKTACAAAWVQQQFPDATGPLVVHRLDMDTSGLLLFALDADAQRALSAQFERRLVDKSYVALVAGHVGPAHGVVSLPLRPDIDNRPVQIVDHVHGQPATTEFRVDAFTPDATRLSLFPRTGKTHQLRVHCATPAAQGGLGHPILGDPLYGDRDAAPRLMLHAASLAFADPDASRVEVTIPAPF